MLLETRPTASQSWHVFLRQSVDAVMPVTEAVRKDCSTTGSKLKITALQVKDNRSQLAGTMWKLQCFWYNSYNTTQNNPEVSAVKETQVLCTTTKFQNLISLRYWPYKPSNSCIKINILTKYIPKDRKAICLAYQTHHLSNKPTIVWGMQTPQIWYLTICW